MKEDAGRFEAREWREICISGFHPFVLPFPAVIPRAWLGDRRAFERLANTPHRGKVSLYTLSTLYIDILSSVKLYTRSPYSTFAFASSICLGRVQRCARTASTTGSAFSKDILPSRAIVISVERFQPEWSFPFLKISHS